MRNPVEVGRFFFNRVFIIWVLYRFYKCLILSFLIGFDNLYYIPGGQLDF